MNFSPTTKKIADVILYEGYLLYPYRASALKNQRRFEFDAVTPGNTVEGCIPIIGESNEIFFALRFLRLSERSLNGKKLTEGKEEEVEFKLTQKSQEIFSYHQFAVESVQTERQNIQIKLNFPVQITIDEENCERHFKSIKADLSIDFSQIKGNVHLLSFHFTNTSPSSERRITAQVQENFAAAHFIAKINGDSRFCSLLEPPEQFADIAAECRNKGVFPILTGNRERANEVFFSPVILYDYPEVAAESSGNMFDSTEIDELLALRILTMTDEEKSEMKATDPRASELLAMVESLKPEDLLRLHGRISDSRNFSSGERVRLRPRSGGDIWDTVLSGQTAIIEAVETDFENNIHLAVVIENDPGRDLGLERLPGHRFFFSPDEVERIVDDE